MGYSCNICFDVLSPLPAAALSTLLSVIKESVGSLLPDFFGTVALADNVLYMAKSKEKKQLVVDDFLLSERYFSFYMRGLSTLPPSAAVRGRALAELRRLSAVSDAARGQRWPARNRGGPRGAGAVTRGGAVML